LTNLGLGTTGVVRVVLSCTVVVTTTTVVETVTSDVEFPATGVELDMPVDSGMLVDRDTPLLDVDVILSEEL
jgi:hypothetical protein